MLFIFFLDFKMKNDSTIKFFIYFILKIDMCGDQVKLIKEDGQIKWK